MKSGLGSLFKKSCLRANTARRVAGSCSEFLHVLSLQLLDLRLCSDEEPCLEEDPCLEEEPCLDEDPCLEEEPCLDEDPCLDDEPCLDEEPCLEEECFLELSLEGPLPILNCECCGAWGLSCLVSVYRLTVEDENYPV